MSTHRIEVVEHEGNYMAMFENRKDLGDFTMGLGKTEWSAIADFVRKKGEGFKLAKEAMPLVGYRLEE